MHAVVLVGGFGTRLRPLTLTVPKPLLPVAHRPMLERLLASLAAGGVTDAVLALGFNPQPFLDAFPGDRCGSVRLRYAVEDSPLDTAGAIGFAARTAEVSGTFINTATGVLGQNDSDLEVTLRLQFQLLF